MIDGLSNKHVIVLSDLDSPWLFCLSFPHAAQTQGSQCHIVLVVTKPVHPAFPFLLRKQVEGDKGELAITWGRA